MDGYTKRQMAGHIMDGGGIFVLCFGSIKIIITYADDFHEMSSLVFSMK